uniref:Titin n=1 Tax=Neolamprologus brichardi TaxID=32507 RepID=A0A3Q4HHD5_NEOBR
MDTKYTVPVAGHPKPIITWTKDGVALKQTTRVNVTDSAQTTTLTIKDATREDGGMYTISVSNDLGSKNATVDVITLDKPGPPTGPVKLDDISAESITLSWEPPTYTGGCPISNYIPVIGRPVPKVEWKKDGQALKETTRINVSSALDSGQYVLTLHNVAGTRSIAINCKVLDRPGPASGPLTVSGLTAEKCTLSWGPPQENGGAEIMHYIVEKRETSRLAWTLVYGDMKAITCKPTSQLSFKHTFESTSVFVKETTRLNSGTYEVKVKNSLGSSCAIVRLLIQGIYLIFIFHCITCIIYAVYTLSQMFSLSNQISQAHLLERFSLRR